MLSLFIFLNKVNNFLHSGTFLFIVIVLVLITILGFWLARKRILKYMAQAEAGAITAEGLAGVIQKIQDSDWDDRMILVVAKLITTNPILWWLPTRLVAKLLNWMVQGTFNSVKDLLHAKAENVYAKRHMTEEQKAKVATKAETMSKGIYDEMDIYIQQLVDNKLKTLIDQLLQAQKYQLQLGNNISVGLNSAVNEVSKKVDKQMEEMKSTYDNVANKTNDIMNKGQETMDDITKRMNDILNMNPTENDTESESTDEVINETNDEKNNDVINILNMFN